MYFRCLSEKEAAQPKKEEKKVEDIIECTTAESDVIAGVMGNVLR